MCWAVCEEWQWCEMGVVQGEVAVLGWVDDREEWAVCRSGTGLEEEWLWLQPVHGRSISSDLRSGNNVDLVWKVPTDKASGKFVELGFVAMCNGGGCIYSSIMYVWRFTHIAYWVELIVQFYRFRGSKINADMASKSFSSLFLHWFLIGVGCQLRFQNR